MQAAVTGLYSQLRNASLFWAIVASSMADIIADNVFISTQNLTGISLNLLQLYKYKCRYVGKWAKDTKPFCAQTTY
jgi:hypothetical protein